MKTAKIPVYGNIALYVYKNRLYTKMLRIHFFSIFTITTPWTLDKCILTITYHIVITGLYTTVNENYEQRNDNTDKKSFWK